ncbi:MAG: hypothetical protein ACLR8P_14265 [Clostridium fessum]
MAYDGKLCLSFTKRDGREPATGVFFHIGGKGHESRVKRESNGITDTGMIKDVISDY